MAIVNGIGIGVPFGIGVSTWLGIAGAVETIIRLELANNTSATDATVLAVPVDGLAADPLQIITIPAGYPRMQGARWVDTVAGGAALGSNFTVNGSFDTDLSGWTGARW